MDAFISHAAADATVATRIEKALEKRGLTAWLDRSDIHCGVLLREELQQAIQNSRVLILLWSKAAAKSRWVAAEILTAFHLNRFIIPCVLDGAKLPPLLDEAVYSDLRRPWKEAMEQLCRYVQEAPNHANDLPAFVPRPSKELAQANQVIHEAMLQESNRFEDRDLAGARAAHAVVEAALKKARARWRWETTLLMCEGYHLKNAYRLKHAEEFHAGLRPQDRLLERAERCFLDVLLVNPNDYSALNGIVVVLKLEGEWDAAEPFARQAVALAERDGRDYPQPRQHLKEILEFQRRRAAAGKTFTATTADSRTTGQQGRPGEYS